MTRPLVFLVAALVATGLHVASGQQGADAEKLFASAQHKATIDGDLKAAIEDYEKAFAAARHDRALAALALVRLAECHQRLGDPEARAIYARVVRDYADQEEAVALVRTRLDRPDAAPEVKGDRSVWTGPDADGFGTISPDGRYLTYTAWVDDAHLALRDLTTGTSHRLTPSQPGSSTAFSAISRDGKWVAFQWTTIDTPSKGDRSTELRVARLQGTVLLEPRRLFANEDIASVSPSDWSPDGKSIAVLVARKDRTQQVALVSVPDGSLRVLKSLDWRSPGRMFFSPDGRYIGYDLFASDDRQDRHVFVLAVDGSRESVVAAHASKNAMMGWSPDGRHVLFSSDRSGTFGLWAVPVVDGRASDGPRLLKPDVASSWSLGITAGGAMYVWKYASPIYVQTSAVDMSSGRLAQGSQTFQRFITSRGRPSWSADGKSLAYQTCNPLGAGPCTLWIRSMESGEVRELTPKLGYFAFTRWSPDGRELLTVGRPIRGNVGVYRIDVQTGEARLIPGLLPRFGLPQWSPDGKHLHYVKDSALIEHDLASGASREVVRFPAGVGDAVVSPDGQYVAYTSEWTARSQEMFVMPFSGGASRSVLRVSEPHQLWRHHWTSDGRALVVAQTSTTGEGRRLWSIDVERGQARPLDIDVSRWLIGDGFHFDPAGRQVAFVANAGEAGMEIRALENFLPERHSGATGRQK